MNNIIKLTKSFKFEAGHALYGYDGLCKNIHGHSYKLFVNINGTIINDSKHKKNEMLMDFSDLKNCYKYSYRSNRSFYSFKHKYPV